MSKRKTLTAASTAKKQKLVSDEEMEKPTFEEQKARAIEWAKQNLNAGSPAAKKAPEVAATAAAIKRAASPKRQPRKVAAVLTPVRDKPVDMSQPLSPVATIPSVANSSPMATVTTAIKKPVSVRKSRAKEPVVTKAEDASVVTETVVSTVSKTNSTKVKSIDDDHMVPLMHHYFNALGCAVQTLLPIFVAFSFVFYGSAALTGWTDENDYAKCAVIISLVYSAVMIFYLFVLLPLIIITRAVDTALFANGATILTSSIVEISILCLFVVGSLLISSYTPASVQ